MKKHTFVFLTCLVLGFSRLLFTQTLNREMVQDALAGDSVKLKQMVLCMDSLIGDFWKNKNNFVVRYPAWLSLTDLLPQLKNKTGSERTEEVLAILQIYRRQEECNQDAQCIALVYSALGDTLKKILHPTHPSVARSYSHAAQHYQKTGQYDQSLDHYRKSLEILRQHYGPEHPDVAGMHNHLGDIYKLKGEYTQALEHYHKSREIYLKIFGEEHPLVASTYNQIGGVYTSKGEYAPALEYLRKSVNLYLKLHDSESPELATMYNNIGLVHQSKGEYDKALDFYQKSLAIRLKLSGSDHIEVAMSYNNLAYIYQMKGEFDKAIDYLQKSLAVFIKNFGNEHPHVATCYNNLGFVYQSLGQYHKALSFLEQGLTIFSQALGQKHPHVGVCYNNVGFIHQSMEQYDKALEYYQKSLSVYQQIFGNNHPNIAMIYQNIGLACKGKGEWNTAYDYFRKSLDLYVQTFGQEHVEVANCHLYLAGIYHAQGNDEKALDHTQQAINALLRYPKYVSVHSVPTLKDEIIHELTLLKAIRQKIAYLLQRQAGIDDVSTAYQNALFAVELIEHLRLRYQSEEAKLVLGKENYHLFIYGFTAASWLYRQTHDPVYLQAAFRFSEKSKAGVLIAALNETKAKRFAGIPDSLLETERRIKNELVAYNKLILEEQSKGNKANLQRLHTLQDFFFELRQQHEQIIRTLEQQYPDYFSLKYQSHSVSLDELQNLMTNQTALLQYFLTDSTLAVFCIKKSKVTLYEIPIDRDFEKHIRNYRRMLMRGERIALSSFIRQSYQLYQLLMPMNGELNDVGHLVIIPDGILNYIPFETLITGQIQEGEKLRYENLPYLICQYTISYNYSATLWSELKKKEPSRARWDYIGLAPVFSKKSGTGYVAMTHELFKNFSNLSTRSLFDRDRLTAIPASKDEVIGVFHYLNQRNYKGEALVYKQASEHTLKSKPLKNYRYLHFATHGFVNEEHPAYSGLILAQDTTSSEDGILYAGETYGLSLDAEAVVLSACETGLGKRIHGEGIIGMTRGFLYAGAGNVIVSLWQVADESTARLMKDYFQTIFQSQLTHQASALRAAKLRMIQNKRFAYPYFWSPFVVIGQ